jgi:hypothetical protein
MSTRQARMLWWGPRVIDSSPRSVRIPRENLRGLRGSPWRTTCAEERLYMVPVSLLARRGLRVCRRPICLLDGDWERRGAVLRLFPFDPRR